MGLSNKIIKSISIIFAALVIAFQLQPAIALASQTCYVSGASTRFGPTPATTSSTNCSSTTAVSTSGGTVQSQNQTSQNQTSQSAPTCQTSFDPLTWLMCPIINTVADAETTLEKVVEQLLQTQPLYFSSTANCMATTSTNTCNQMKFSAALFSVWSTFRVYGNIVLVIALLVIVIGEAVGGGVFEAYNLRKVLPRILVAAILINLSIYIVAALEDIFNILGASMQTLIETPFKAAAASVMNCTAASGSTQITGMCIQPGAGTGAIFSLGLLALIGVAFSGVGIGVVLMVVLSGLVAALGVLVTLMLREGILVFLLIASPIAFALYVMPNTEKYFKQWWSQLIKTLMVYPVVTVVFGMAYVTSIIMGDFGLSPKALSQTFATLAMIAPLFLIPFAFRISGGVMASVSGAVSKLQRRATAPMMKQARKSFGNTFNRRKAGGMFKGGTDSNFRGRINRGVQKTLNAPQNVGANPLRWRTNINSAISNQDFMGGMENLEKNKDFAAIKDNDNLLKNGLLYDDVDSLMLKGGLSADEASSVMRAKRSMGYQNFAVAASLALPATGTAFENGAGEMLELVNKVAGNDRQLAGRMLASMRSSAMQAGRVDLGGAGYGDMLNTMNAMHEGRVTQQEATDTIDKAAIKSQGVSAFLNSKSKTFDRLSGVFTSNLSTAYQARDVAVKKRDDALKSGDTAAAAAATEEINQASIQIDNELANIANTYDQLSAASPEKGQIFATQVLGADIPDSYEAESYRLSSGIVGPIKTPSVRQIIESRRSDPANHPAFHDRRREQQLSSQARPGVDPLSNDGTGGVK